MSGSFSAAEFPYIEGRGTPFDVSNVLSNHPYVYGTLEDGALIGVGVIIRQKLAFDGVVMSNIVGTVVGQKHGRVVVRLLKDSIASDFEVPERSDIFLGWVDVDVLEVIALVDQTPTHH